MLIVPRETQPRFPSKNALAHFYLETAGCRDLTKSKTKHPQGESSAHTCVSITEPQDVGHKVSKHKN